MLANELDVPVIDKARRRVDDVPALFHEANKRSAFLPRSLDRIESAGISGALRFLALPQGQIVKAEPLH